MRSSNCTAFAISASGIGLIAPDGDELSVSPAAAVRTGLAHCSSVSVGPHSSTVAPLMSLAMMALGYIRDSADAPPEARRSGPSLIRASIKRHARDAAALGEQLLLR